MDHDQFWSANGPPSQAPNGIHDYMLPLGLVDQPLSDDHPNPWTLCQESAYPSRFDGPDVYTQGPSLLHACGMPSPAPTASASSPSDWPKHDVSSVSASWVPMSPTSPSVGESREGEFHPFNMLLYAAGTTTPPGFDSGLQDWRNGLGLAEFNHPYSSFPAPSVSHGLSGHFGKPWPIHTPLETLPMEPFTRQDFAYAPASDTAGSMLGFLQEHSTHFAEPLSPPSVPNQHQSESQQRPKAPHRRAKSSSNSPNPTTAPAGTISKPSLSPSPSPVSPSSPNTTPAGTVTGGTSNTGPSLRTAARRFKRPTPLPKPGESPEHRRARTNHNLVEQQYRHRLHARFEALLEVLPEGIAFDEEGEGDADGDGQGGGGGGGEEVMVAVTVGGGAGAAGGNGSGSGKGGGGKKNRRMSKVDVLSKAAKVIRYLESDYERVRREVEVLRREREVVLGGMATVGR